MLRSRFVLAALAAMLAVGALAQPRYPAHWWTAVSKEGAPSWEILPQEAGPGEVICRSA